MLERILEVEVMDSASEAQDYNSMDHTGVNRVFVDDLLQALSQNVSHSPEDEDQQTLDILDLGTGTALIPIELCPRAPQVRVLAVDLAVHMLDLARYNIEGAGLAHRISLAQIDAKGLPFDSGRFDVVMSNSIIHHIPQPLAALREAARVVKSGGRLFFRDLLRPADEATLQALVQTYAGTENDHCRQMFADSLHAALSLPEIRALVGQLGFAPDTVQATTDRHWTWSAQA